MKSKVSMVPALALIIMIAGCSMFVSAPKSVEKGDNVVCVLMKETDFKKEVVKQLGDALSSQGCRIISDSNKRAKYYKAHDYAAIVYMAELWAWHTPWHAKSYWKNNNRAENIVIVVTAGDPDVEISKPFDAITCPSRKERIEPVVKEIVSRIEDIGK